MSRARKQCRPKPSRPRTPPADGWQHASTPEEAGATPDEVARLLAVRAASREPWACNCAGAREIWAHSARSVALGASHLNTCRWWDTPQSRQHNASAFIPVATPAEVARYEKAAEAARYEKGPEDARYEKGPLVFRRVSWFGPVQRSAA